MRKGWSRTRLGEVTKQHVDKFKVEPGSVYKNLGVKWYAEGVFSREPKLGSDMKATSLYRVREGQFIYNRMFATEGSFALVTKSFADGVVSNEFPVFDVDSSRALPEYLRLHFQQPTVWADVAAECVGTTKSRSRWKEQRFAEYEIALPPLEEQKRIVDLIGSLDDSIEAADEAYTTTNASLSAHLSKLFEDDEHVTLDMLAAVQVGFAFKSGSFRDEGVRLLRGDNVTPNGLRWDKAAHIESENIDSRIGEFALELGDIVIAMDRPVISTGTKVCIIEESDLPALLVQRVARLRVTDPLTREGISLALKSDNFRYYLSRVQTGAHAPHITKSNVEDFSFPKQILDSLEIALLRALNSQAVAASTYATSLRTLRSELLTVLLSGEHEIPESYDVDTASQLEPAA